MAILTMFRHRFYKNDGTVNAGGKVYTYVAGTTTPTETYTDSGAGTPNANPIILDAKGEADIWVSGQIKVNVLESDDTQVTGWPVDNVGSGVSNNDATSRWAGTATGTADALAISPSPAISAYTVGQSFIFKAGASDNTGATTIAISGLAAIAAQSNGAAMTGGEILANKFYIGVLDTLTTCQISKIGEPTLTELGAAALAGATFTGPVNQPYATVASHATAADIWSVGPTINWTGTATVTALPDAPAAGARRTLNIASYGAKFTLGANITMDGFASGYTYTCYAGMIVEVLALTTTTFRLMVRPYSGTWSAPTLYNTTNVASSTTSSGQFFIVGSRVSCGLSLLQDPTTASIATVLDIAIGEGASSPPASGFTNQYNVNGTASMDGANGSAQVYADTINDRITMKSYPPIDTNQTWRLNFIFDMK